MRTGRRTGCALALAAVLFPLATLARGPAPLPAQGENLRQWMDLQRKAPVASMPAPELPPGVAERIYERYLNSFAHPLPESFGRQRFVEQE